MGLIVRMNDESLLCDVQQDAGGQVQVHVDGELVTFQVRTLPDDSLLVEDDTGQHVIHWMTHSEGFELLDGTDDVVVTVQDERDTWLSTGGVGGAAGAIKSQMPGKVVSVNVAVGQTVQSGETLLSLEAMKMENEVVSSIHGIVRSVNVEAGSNVEAGELLVVLGEVDDE